MRPLKGLSGFSALLSGCGIALIGSARAEKGLVCLPPVLEPCESWS